MATKKRFWSWNFERKPFVKGIITLENKQLPQYATHLWENRNSSKLRKPEFLQFLEKSNIQIYCQNHRTEQNIRLGIYLSSPLSL